MKSASTKKRMLPLLLAAILVMGLLPVSAWANETTGGGTGYNNTAGGGDSDSSTGGTGGAGGTNIPGAAERSDSGAPAGNTNDANAVDKTNGTSAPDTPTAPDDASGESGASGSDADNAGGATGRTPQENDEQAARAEAESDGAEPKDSFDLSPLQLRAEATTLPAATYYLRPFCSATRMLDIVGGSSAAGALLQLYRSNKTAAQKFALSYDQNGYATLTAVSGKVLEVKGRVAANDAAVWQNSANGSLAQKWIIAGDAKSGFTITSALSKDNSVLRLDVTKALDADGTKLRVSKASTGTSQRFHFLAVNYAHPGTQTVPDGIYAIAPKGNAGLRLEIPGASAANAVQLQTYQSNSTLAQYFALRWRDNHYSITSLASGKVLDVAGGGIISTTAAQQYASNSSAAQRWQIELLEANAEPVVAFVASTSGLVLDVTGGSKAAGAKLQVYNRNGSAAQAFVLKPVAVAFPQAIYALAPRADAAKRLDVVGASQSSGAAVQAYPANQSGAQAFEIIAQDSATPGIFAIRTAHSGMYLTEANSGNIAQLAAPSKELLGQNQLWRITLGVGGYVLVNQASGHALTLSGTRLVGAAYKAGAPTAKQLFSISATAIIQIGTYELYTPAGNRLEVLGNGKTSGSKVRLNTSNGSQAQKWSLGNAGNGSLSIKKAYTALALDVVGGSKLAGAALQIYQANSSAAQKFKLIPSGNGWYLLRSDLGTYLAAGSDTAGASIVTTSDKAAALSVKLQTTQAWPAGFTASRQGSYAEVNLSTQQMIYVNNGEIVLFTDIVSGAPVSLTPTGIFNILYVQTNTRLIGPTWNVAVSYWFPITWNGYGLHDATWQPAFGGQLWKTNGSHGCVNMPLEAAQTFYRYARAGTTVLIHY